MKVLCEPHSEALKGRGNVTESDFLFEPDIWSDTSRVLSFEYGGQNPQEKIGMEAEY